MVQNAQWVQPVLLLKVLKDLEKDGVERAWRNRVKELADLIVTGYRIDAEQGLGVILNRCS